MPTISQFRYALPSLVFSLIMSATTLVHHLHSGLFLHPDSQALHVVWNELVLIPATCLSMYFFVKRRSSFAFWVYLLIALAAFIFLGLYEGGWNHTIKLLGYLRIDSSCTNITSLLPAANLHVLFYETTGVLTLIFTLIASYYSFRFYTYERKITPFS